MFTGIIQTVGTVRSVQRTGAGVRLVLDAPGLERPIPDGASVCVNGACLTATSSDEARVTFDVVPETLATSTLDSLTLGSKVNLERSLRASDGLEGHMVQGHVDGTAEVRDIRRDETGYRITVSADDQLKPYLIAKGSVAIDGISLTIADVTSDTFTVAIIPTTARETTLGELKVGQRVNIETDIISRTVVATLERWRNASDTTPGITMDILREQGYA